jgi:hypothetical protein
MIWLRDYMGLLKRERRGEISGEAECHGPTVRLKTKKKNFDATNGLKYT